VAAPVATEIVKGYFENVVQGGRPANVAQVPLPPGKGVPTPSGVEEVDEDVDDGVPAAVTGPQPNP
jgi:hypothetical protein